MKRPPSKHCQDLIVWQKAHEFVLSIYGCSESFPKNELYGLTSQVRRSAISVPSNIAEGSKKKTKPDKMRFLDSGS
jgi:four helix bundle protein